jgi:glutaredoxin
MNHNSLKITIYSTTICPYCQFLKEWLTHKSLTFDEYLIDRDPEKLQEMLILSDGERAVPFTIIEHDGKTTKIFGFNRSKFNKILAQHDK